jgi:hypothetical protein
MGRMDGPGGIGGGKVEGGGIEEASSSNQNIGGGPSWHVFPRWAALFPPLLSSFDDSNFLGPK